MANPRRFDHEEAARLHAEGMSYGALAKKYGVTANATYQAIRRLTDPEWAKRSRDHGRQFQRDQRVPCRRCGERLVYVHMRNASGLCARCSGVERSVTVRQDTLLCGECGEWKPDEDFPKATGKHARRYRHTVCRPCQAVAKRRQRANRAVPCTRCGKPRSHPKDRGSNTSRYPDTGLCRECYDEERALPR